MSLDIKYKNLKYQNDFVSSYSLLNHQLNEKTTRTKRGKSKNSKIISKSMIVKEINMLQKEFSSNFNWQSVRKFLFGIKKKFLTTYLNVFLSKSYNKHFSDIFNDTIMFKIILRNIKFLKKSAKMLL